MSESLTRLHVLRKNIADELDSALTLKHHSDTRWSSRKKCVDAILSCLPQLYNTLVDITEGKEISLTTKSSALQHIGRHNRGKGDFFDPKVISFTTHW